MRSSRNRKSKPARRSPSTAIARRPRQYPGETFAPTVQVMGPASPVPHLDIPRTLTTEIRLEAIGLAELKVTEREREILARPVNVDDVRVKPNGVAYLSHPAYTKWINEAFGVLGWALVPAALPSKVESSVVVPYTLHVHGKPVAFAWGEQEYFVNNKDQSWGDALEATVASALRRMAKRLGVGLELWDRPWTENYLEQRCVLVSTGRGKLWRRRDDRPFYDELGPARASSSAQVGGPEKGNLGRADSSRDARAGSNAHGGEPISDKQRRRLWAIIQNSGRMEDDVRDWLEREHGFASSKDVTRDRYEEVCEAIEQPGPLPARR